MSIYYFRLYQCGDEDGYTVWTEADSQTEAENDIRSDYYNIDELVFLKKKD